MAEFDYAARDRKNTHNVAFVVIVLGFFLLSGLTLAHCMGGVS